MKIVHVITRLIVGGAQENTLLSCRGQHQRGHDVTLITGPSTGPEGSLVTRAAAEGYRIIELPKLVRAVRPITDISATRRLIKLYRQLSPDIIHTHSSKAGILGRIAAAKYNAKLPPPRRAAIVHTIHGLAFTASKSALVNHAYRLAEKFTAPLTHRIVCVATAMADQSLAAHVGQPHQYTTVYSGMDTQPFLDAHLTRDAVRRELAIAPTDVIVGTIARLFHMKGHDDILAIAPTLCQRFPHLRFLWVGDGILRETFQRRILALGLSSRFIFTGLVPPTRVPALTGAMDILLHPSYREGLARAIPQGQLAGCPVIAYDVDGNREGLLHNQTGYMIPLSDTHALSTSLAHLLENPSLRTTMAAAGQSFAAARFSTEAMINGLESAYAQALTLARP
jgi:glycosyltransferase involved in cell wall biosynthesis